MTAEHETLNEEVNEPATQETVNEDKEEQEQEEQEEQEEQAREEDEEQEQEEQEPSLGFAELDLEPRVIDALIKMGFEKPTDVQIQAIPLALAKKDMLVQSRTGTGKTTAFGAPIVQRLLDAEPRAWALILAPTRELALQVAAELERICEGTPVRVTAIYGGAAMGPQIDALRQGTHIVVGTPGRVLDHIRRRNFDTSSVQTLVLDEGDEMLSMGFLEEITSIIEQLPEERHTMVFSATIPEEIQRLADRYTKEPAQLRLSDDFIGVYEIQHVYYLVSGSDRSGDLLKVLEYEAPDTALVFCNTRDDTAQVADYLHRNGFKAEGISSDLTQRERERVMKRMRSGELQFLVATDIAARGIDLSDLSHVINYTFPESPDVYIHRTGRTGRAGKSGVAVSLVSPREIGSFYYLKLMHKIYPEERHLPSAAEMASRREAARFAMLQTMMAGRDTSEELRGLARRVWSTVDGERLVALALAAALEEKSEIFAAPVETPGAREERPRPRREARDHDRDRPRGRRDDRRGDDRGRGDRDRGRRGRRDERGRDRDRDSRDRDKRRGRDRDRDRDGRDRDRRPRDRDRDRDRDQGRSDRKLTRTRRRPENGTFTTPDGDVEHWEIVETEGDRTDTTSARLFINLGRHQGVRASDLCTFLLAETGLANEQVAKVQVRSSYSFFNVPEDAADSVIEKLEGKSYAEREIRVERAKAK